MSDHFKWATAGALLVAAMVVGALGYEPTDSMASAIGYGFGVGLVAVVLTALGRFIYLRAPEHRDEPVWTPTVLAIAGAVGLLSVVAIAIADTQG